MSIRSVNPTTGEVLETCAETTPKGVERILDDVHRAFLDWRRRPVKQRAQGIGAAARVLRAKKEAHARTMALEMGKPIAQGEGEVEKCAWGCEYYAEHAEEFLAPQPHQTDARRSYVRFDPLGPVLAIMPWNFPFWHVLPFAAPALAAARTAAEARLINNGQSCIAAKRCIVVEAVAERFVDLFVTEMRSRRMGDPLRPDTQVGPQARRDLRDDLHRQVEESVRRGAEVLLGGRIPEGPGAFYPPTVLVAVRPGMPAFDEETFGPVAAVIRARDEAEAIG